MVKIERIEQKESGKKCGEGKEKRSKRWVKGRDKQGESGKSE